MTEPTFESAQRELRSSSSASSAATPAWTRRSHSGSAGEELYRFCRDKLDAAEGEIEELAKRAESRGAPVRLESRACLRQSNRSSTSLFSDLDQRELQSLASSFKERIFDAGSTVVAEGSAAWAFSSSTRETPP